MRQGVTLSIALGLSVLNSGAARCDEVWLHCSIQPSKTQSADPWPTMSQQWTAPSTMIVDPDKKSLSLYNQETHTATPQGTFPNPISGWQFTEAAVVRTVMNSVGHENVQIQETIDRQTLDVTVTTRKMSGDVPAKILASAEWKGSCEKVDAQPISESPHQQF